MTGILAKNLSGMEVMGSDGVELGMLYNVTMDLRTGQLHDIIVDPNEEVNVSSLEYETDEEGRLQVPVAQVQAVKDYIVVGQ
ncbi:MAG: PRC-barrel domain-containing protein [Halobacteriales archaeon]